MTDINMLKLIDSFLNSFTMYRVVLYGLIGLALISILFSFLGILSYNPISMIVSLVILLNLCYFSNLLFAKMLNAPLNAESSAVTAMILFFLMKPPDNINDALSLVMAGLIAMASKYIFAINKKHIFNPAAISAFILGLLGNGNVYWWVGADVLLPLVAILGFLIVRKIRRFHLLFAFLLSALASIAFVGVTVNDVTIPNALSEAFLSWPLIFFATVMMTEPLTTPPVKNLRIIYGVIVGLLFGAQFEFGRLFSSPEFALIVGNVYSFIVSPKERLTLYLKEQTKLASHLQEFVFTSSQKFAFQPGQYLEWTLPLKRTDGRGNRRYFTIASSPTEQEIKLGVKIEEANGSTFKKQLSEMKKDDMLAAGQLSGDFTMPKDTSKKLLFIAGGIGVTPFRSMMKYLVDKGEKRDIVMLYTTPHPDELAYIPVFDEAESKLGVKVIYVITRDENAPQDWKGKKGRINEDMLKEVAPDFKERIAYLSGPNAMVDSYKSLLHQVGVNWKNIKADYFPGY